MLTINPKDVSIPEFHAYLVGTIAPRPIAFVSSVDKDGNVNLSPFSYFNLFGTNPPTLVFSPSTRVRDNTPKHTLENVLEHDEVVINMVNFDMVAQMSLASTEFKKGVNEFVKAGFTELPSLVVKPPRVKESSVSFECKVRDVIRVGEEGGAANLVICEVLLAHIKEDLVDEQKQIDPYKLDAVARLGADWYCRAQGDAIFKLPRPNRNIGIGVDALPDHIRYSKILSGNDLGLLGNLQELPGTSEVEDLSNKPNIKEVIQQFSNDHGLLKEALQKIAKNYVSEGRIREALAILMIK